MVRRITLGIVVLFTTLSAFSQNNYDRSVKNEAFGFSERLNYDIKYKFIKAGEASFIVGSKPVMMNNGKNKCYDIRFEVNSLKSLEFLYKVQDMYKTLLDVDGIYPWFFQQRIREGNYKKDYKATFDVPNQKALTSDGNFDIPLHVHDIVSAFYYIRTMDLGSMKRGEVIKLKNFFDKKTHDLGVKILGKQTIETEAGIFNCVVIEPMIKDGGLFKSDGKILLWMSDDARKIPVKVSTRIPIGAIDAELTSFSGLRGPLTGKVTKK